MRLEHGFLGTEHVFLAMLLDGGSLLCRLLESIGGDPGDVEEAILREVQPSSVSRLQGFPLTPRIRRIVVEAERMCGEDGRDAITESHLLLAMLRGGPGVAVRALERCGLTPADLLQSYLQALQPSELSATVPGRPGQPAEVDDEAQTVPGRARPRVQDLLPEVDDDAPTMPGRLRPAVPDDALPPGRPRSEEPAEARTVPGRLRPPPPFPGPVPEPVPEAAPPRRRESRAPEDMADDRPPAPRRDRPVPPARPKPPPASAFPPRNPAAPTPMLPLAGNPVLIDMGIIKTPTIQTQSGTPTLDKIGRDLTQLAREGRLGPIVGRDEEIEELTRSLCRASRNNPLLQGEPGVGKTSIVEALAIDVVQGNVPATLLDVRIVEIPVAALTADTKFRGELEERLMKLVEEARSHNTILVIDEIHGLVGGGKSENVVDAASVLRPYLSRGEVRVIGTTTPRGFTQHMEKDSALVRCFHLIKVEEPSDACIVEILRDAAARFQSFHGVTVSEDALEAAVRLCRLALKDRRLPDVAIDALDEACVRSVERAFGRTHRRTDKKPVVGADQVAEVVSRRSGIPVESLSVEEKTRMARMEEALRKEIVGQDEAVHRVSERIRMYKAGFREERRPLGVFLFLGPTGVGKTEMARAIAQFLFNGDEHLHRYDMSEFMDAHEAAKLIGSPPGYVGYGEDGQLTGAVRRDPHCVVLLDEIEKAHPKIFDLFLQVFDEGRLTDGKGVVTDFTHAIVVMTSNLGADLWKDPRSIGFRRKEGDEDRRDRMTETLKGTFRPEFLNRLDDILLFRPLDPDSIRRIASQMVARWQERSAKQGYPFEVDDAVLGFLCEKGFDAEMGARPMKRAVEQHLVQPLSMRVLEGAVRPGQVMRAVMEGDRVVFEPA